jgi:hypothetical protein
MVLPLPTLLAFLSVLSGLSPPLKIFTERWLQLYAILLTEFLN